MRHFAVLVCLACAVPAIAQTRSEIQAKYDRFASAYVKNDVDAMLSVLSRSYKITSESGSVKSYAQYRKQLVERRRAGRTAKAYRVEIATFEGQGNALNVLTREVTQETDGTESAHYYRDRWRKEKGGWKLVATLGLPADFSPECG